MSKAYWDSEVEMVRVKISNYSEYRIHARTKDGKKFISVREWHWTKDDPTPRYGVHGVSFEVTKNGDIASCLISSLNEALRYFNNGGQ